LRKKFEDDESFEMPNSVKNIESDSDFEEEKKEERSDSDFDDELKPKAKEYKFKKTKWD
jgi:hypothetical protein